MCKNVLVPAGSELVLGVGEDAIVIGFEWKIGVLVSVETTARFTTDKKPHSFAGTDCWSTGTTITLLSGIKIMILQTIASEAGDPDASSVEIQLDDLQGMQCEVREKECATA